MVYREARAREREGVGREGGMKVEHVAEHVVSTPASALRSQSHPRWG